MPDQVPRQRGRGRHRTHCGSRRPPTWVVANALAVAGPCARPNSSARATRPRRPGGPRLAGPSSAWPEGSPRPSLIHSSDHQMAIRRRIRAVCVCSVSPLGHRSEGPAVTDRWGLRGVQERHARNARGRLSTGRPACRRPVESRFQCPRPGRRCSHAIDATFVHAHHVGRSVERLVGRGPVRIRRRHAATVDDVAGRSRTHARPGPVARRRSATPPPDGGPGSFTDPRRIRGPS
jgi:hypothetical protein